MKLLFKLKYNFIVYNLGRGYTNSYEFKGYKIYAIVPLTSSVVICFRRFNVSRKELMYCEQDCEQRTAIELNANYYNMNDLLLLKGCGKEGYWFTETGQQRREQDRRMGRLQRNGLVENNQKQLGKKKELVGGSKMQ